MSRTTRRKGRNPYPREEHVSWSGNIIHFGYHDWEYHSDKYRWRGNAWSITKEFTRWRRRVDEKAMIHRIVKDQDFEYVDLENLYKGYIWNFD